MKKTDVLANLFLSLLAFLLPFAALETYFWIADKYTPPETFKFYQYDSLLGWKNKPFAESTFTIPDSKTHVKINSKGFRDVEHDYAAPQEKIRIVVLGDSFTQGYGVEQDERYSSRLATLLPSNYEIINLGISGYGTDQELLTLRNEGLNYSPDFVVVGFQISSDIVNNQYDVQYRHPKPVFTILPNGALRLNNVPVPKTTQDAPLQAVKNFLREHVRTYNFFAETISRSSAALNIFRRLGLVLAENASKQPEEYDLNITFALLAEMNRIAQQNNAKPILILIPDKKQAYRNGTALDDVNSALISFSKENGVPVLDLLPMLRSHPEKENLYFKLDGHWNAKGHAIAAELIYSNLKNILLQTPP